MDFNSIDRIRKLPFFFVLGRPRSGTTLLRTLLDVHPSINIPLENSGMIHLYYKYRKIKHWKPKHYREFHNDFRNLKYLESWNLDWDRIEEQILHSGKTPLNFHELIRVYHAHFKSEFAKEEIKVLGDKSPINSLYSMTLFQAFPEAKFIHLVRDYRANMASMSKHDVFSPSSTFIVMQWKKSVRQISKLAEKHPESYLQVRYEDLVRNPVTTFEKICDFLQVEFSAELLDPHYRKRAIRNIYNASFLNQWQPDLSERISTTHIDKWKSELSPASVRKADYIAGNTARLLQYEPMDHKYSLSFRFITALKMALFHLNEMNRYLYDRLPYRMKEDIKNRRFILSHRLIQYYRRQIEKH